jgi:hypothetical protein
MPPMLLNNLSTRLLHLALTQRVRVPRFETVLLCCGLVAYAFCAVGLEDHGFEGAGCGWHCDDMAGVGG